PRWGGAFSTDSARLLNAEDLLGLGQGVNRFLMLTGLVQGFAFGPVLLHFRQLLGRESRLLGQRVVDGLHVYRTVVRKRGAAGEREGQRGDEMANFHELLRGVGVAGWK